MHNILENRAEKAKQMGLFSTKQESLNTRLIRAIKSRNLEKMETLIASGANVNAMRKDYGWSALYQATTNEFSAGALLLLEKGADPNIGYGDRSALMEASYDGSYSIAEALLKKGATVDDTDAYGDTAMHKAAKRGRANIIRLLESYGANKGATNNRMETPADLASKEFPRVADMLMGRERPPSSSEDDAPKTPAPAVQEQERQDQDGWRLTAQDEVAHVTVRAEIGYRLTEIFNFTTQTYTRLAQNMATGAESQSLKFFDECGDSVLLRRAETALTQLGGRTVPVQKPAFVLQKPKGGA